MLTHLYVFAQLQNPNQGWLTSKLLGVTLSSAEWVLWILAAVSIISIGLMLERAFFFATNRLPNSEELALRLARGEVDQAKAAIEGRKGMEAAVIREALLSAGKGADTVEE